MSLFTIAFCLSAVYRQPIPNELTLKQKDEVLKAYLNFGASHHSYFRTWYGPNTSPIKKNTVHFEVLETSEDLTEVKFRCDIRPKMQTSGLAVKVGDKWIIKEFSGLCLNPMMTVDFYNPNRPIPIITDSEEAAVLTETYFKPEIQRLDLKLLEVIPSSRLWNSSKSNPIVNGQVRPLPSGEYRIGGIRRVVDKEFRTFDYIDTMRTVHTGLHLVDGKPSYSRLEAEWTIRGCLLVTYKVDPLPELDPEEEPSVKPPEDPAKDSKA